MHTEEKKGRYRKSHEEKREPIRLSELEPTMVQNRLVLVHQIDRKNEYRGASSAEQAND